MSSKVKTPSKTLCLKYKNALLKATLKEYGLSDKAEYDQAWGGSAEQYKKEVDTVKKQIYNLKYDDKGLVFFVSKNFPKDKFYQELREKQKFSIFKMFGY